MVLRFRVIDGADLRKLFLLPEQGKATIGSSPRHADIVLHDLYVGRLHCEIEVGGGQVLIRPIAEGNGVVLINGKKITEQQMDPGDVLRIGNSHLRLEPHDSADIPEEEESETPPAPASRKLPHLPLDRLPELAGEVLAHYAIGEVLGRGHYGIVFRARDQKTGQTVALKVLSPDFPQGRAEMETFVAAIKTLLPLRHANLVTLYNAGRTGPYCWLALEPVEGESLAAELRERDAKTRSHWKLALRMGVHLTRALEFLGKHRLVHGNIAPANVLVRQDRVVKLGDLMLSRALEGSALQGARLEGKLLAELGYLAPEQTMHGASIDGLTDLYGVGAVVYARLTGQPPFHAETPEDTLELINTSVPAKPRDVHKNIPDALSVVVMRLLSRRPEDRYQTPEELLADLEMLAAEEGIEV